MCCILQCVASWFVDLDLTRSSLSLRCAAPPPAEHQRKSVQRVQTSDRTLKWDDSLQTNQWNLLSFHPPLIPRCYWCLRVITLQPPKQVSTRKTTNNPFGSQPWWTKNNGRQMWRDLPKTGGWIGISHGPKVQVFNPSSAPWIWRVGKDDERSYWKQGCCWYVLMG